MPLGFGDELVARARRGYRPAAGRTDRMPLRRPPARRPCSRITSAPHRSSGKDDRRGDADIRARRRTGRDVPTPGHFRRRYRHYGRGDVAVAPARHVAAGRLTGYQPLPGDEARQYLDLDIGRLCSLRFGEAADVVMGKADVVLQLRRQCSAAVSIALSGDDQSPVHLSRLLGIACGRGFAARLDLAQHRFRPFRVTERIAAAGLDCLLQICGHRNLWRKALMGAVDDTDYILPFQGTTCARQSASACRRRRRSRR